MIQFTELCYPDDINIERDVLAFLAMENDITFCNVALVTDRLGISVTTCFVGINPEKTEIFVISEGRRYRDVQVVGEKNWKHLRQSRVALITVSKYTDNL